MSATRVAQSVIFSYADKSGDETYRFVTRRENEIFLSERKALYESIVSRLDQ